MEKPYWFFWRGDEDSQRQYCGDPDVWIIPQLADEQVHRDTGDDIGLITAVTLPRCDVVDNAVRGAT